MYLSLCCTSVDCVGVAFQSVIPEWCSGLIAGCPVNRINRATNLHPTFPGRIDDHVDETLNNTCVDVS